MNLRLMRLMKMHKLMDAAGELNAGGGDGSGNKPADGETKPADGETKSDDEGETKKEDGDQPPADKGDAKPSDAEAKLLREQMKEKEKRKAAESELQALREAAGNMTKEELAALVASHREREEQAALARGDYDKLKAQIQAERETERAQFTTRETELANQNAKLQAQIEELTIGSAFTGSKMISEELTLPVSKARALYGSHFDLVDGKVVGFDKPRGAEGRVQLVGADGESVSFEVALGRLIDADPDRDTLRRSQQKSGAGSQPQPQSAKAKASAVEVGTGMSRIAHALSKQSK